MWQLIGNILKIKSLKLSFILHKVKLFGGWAEFCLETIILKGMATAWFTGYCLVFLWSFSEMCKSIEISIPFWICTIQAFMSKCGEWPSCDTEFDFIGFVLDVKLPFLQTSNPVPLLYFKYVKGYYNCPFFLCDSVVCRAVMINDMDNKLI